MEATGNTGAAIATVVDDPLLKTFKSHPHQAFSAQDVVKLTDPKTAKDPLKLQEAASELGRQLAKRVELTSSSDGFGFSSSMALAAMIIPAVQ